MLARRKVGQELHQVSPLAFVFEVVLNSLGPRGLGQVFQEARCGAAGAVMKVKRLAQSVQAVRHGVGHRFGVIVLKTQRLHGRQGTVVGRVGCAAQAFQRVGTPSARGDRGTKTSACSKPFQLPIRCPKTVTTSGCTSTMP